MKKILATFTLIIAATAGLATRSTVESQLSKEHDAATLKVVSEIRKQAPVPLKLLKTDQN